MASTKQLSPRQKMINLMYLVFIAMLALNVSTEVLDGFDLINDNLLQSIENTIVRNKQIYSEIETSFKKNPGKTQSSYSKAQNLKAKSDSIFDFIQLLKHEIVRKSDGAKGDIYNLRSRDNLDAASEVMLSPINGQGEVLKQSIDRYRENIISLIADTSKQQVIRASLSTEPSKRARRDNKSWVQASFDRMPSIAAMTYLSELQVNIRQAEGEALNSLLKEIDLSDFRVNELTAFVVPQSNIVMQGTNYKANIILAAVDTTQRPRIVVNGQELPKENNGVFEVTAGAPGTHTLSGFLELLGRDGVPFRRDFSQEYTVIEPMATVAPLLMDVLYAGINNPISISVPGVAGSDVVATAQGGTIAREGKEWVARTSNVGQNFTITVSAKINGTQRTVAQKQFRVRALPDPTAYISYNDENGNPKMFKKGAIARSILLNAPGIKASIDDGILNIPFTVLTFSTVFVDVMGNVMPEVSDGANFSSRQLDQIRKMNRGKSFFISRIKVKGPDGIEREISPMEVRVN